MTVANERQFRRASEHLSLSEPAISAHIKELEMFLGIPLLSRTTRQVRLTAEGEKFLIRATRALSELESDILEMQDYASLQRGRIVVAAVPSIASKLLPPAIAQFVRRYPGIKVEVMEQFAASVEQSVESGEADLGLMPKPNPSAELSFKLLLHDRFVCIVSRAHPLAGRTVVQLRELARFPIIATMPGTNIRETLAKLFTEPPSNVGVSYSAMQHETVVAMVAANLGVSLPTVSIGSKEGISVISIKPAISREVGVVTMKGTITTSAVTELLKGVEETMLTRPALPAKGI